MGCHLYHRVPQTVMDAILHITRLQHLALDFPDEIDFAFLSSLKLEQPEGQVDLCVSLEKLTLAYNTPGTDLVEALRLVGMARSRRETAIVTSRTHEIVNSLDAELEEVVIVTREYGGGGRVNVNFTKLRPHILEG